MNKYNVNEIVRIKPFRLMSASEVSFMDAELVMGDYCECLARIVRVSEYSSAGCDTYIYI